MSASPSAASVPAPSGSSNPMHGAPEKEISMRHISLVSVFWWFVVICAVIYVVQNPATAGGNIRGVFQAGITFMQSLTGG